METPSLESPGQVADQGIQAETRMCPLGATVRKHNVDTMASQHENFYRMYDEIADLASITSENLVVCYDGKRIFAPSNPHGIGVWAEAELGMPPLCSNVSSIGTHQCNV